MTPAERIARAAVVRAFRASFFVRGAVTFGVRVFVRDATGAVFLVRHGYTDGWHLPGGGVEAGETAERAALRELREEAGLAAERARLFALYRNPRLRDHVALYLVDEFRVAAPPPLGREIAEAGFFATSALPDATTPATRRRLAEILEAVPPDPIW